MTIVVLRHARVLSHPGARASRKEDRAELLSPGVAFTRRFATDAHFVGYEARQFDRPFKWRCNHGAIGAVDVEMVWLILDVDAPGHEASEEWWAAELLKLQRLPAPPSFTEHAAAIGSCGG